MPISDDPISAMRAKPAYVVSLYMGRLAFIPAVVVVREMAGYTTRRSPHTVTHLIALAALGLLLFLSYLYGESVRPVYDGEGRRRPRAVVEERVGTARFVDFFVLWWPRRLPDGHAPDVEQPAVEMPGVAPRQRRKRLGRRR